MNIIHIQRKELKPWRRGWTWNRDASTRVRDILESLRLQGRRANSSTKSRKAQASGSARAETELCLNAVTKNNKVDRIPTLFQDRAKVLRSDVELSRFRLNNAFRFGHQCLKPVAPLIQPQHLWKKPTQASSLLISESRICINLSQLRRVCIRIDQSCVLTWVTPEPRIAADIGLRIKPRKNLVEECFLLGFRPRPFELHLSALMRLRATDIPQ